MIINKIHVSSNVVRIGYIENEKEVPREYTLKSKELARPELYKAMENIFMSWPMWIPALPRYATGRLKTS